MTRAPHPSGQRQSGLVVVELALVGLIAFILLFGAIEFGRLMYTWNVMTEGTRRGARVAAVCPIDEAGQTKVKRATLFRDPNGDGLAGDIGFPGLEPDNVQVEYLKADGTAAATRNDVEFVRVSIINYELQLLIPGLFPTITMPSFATTLPAESLGVDPGSTPKCVFP
jgi:Flp pilus assembly protein TadG